jgi:UDP-N-acetyl-2-amino-2-deoxyglucuronate dehydrogenase
MRVAVIGAGVGAMAHLLALSELGWPVVAVATRREDRAAAVHELHPEARVCWPADDAFRTGVDLAIVASPADTHLDMVRLAASNVVDVVVEKPLHARLDLAEELVGLARKTGIGLAVCLQHRAKPAGRAFKSLVDSGELGELTGGSVSVPWWRPQSYYDVPGRGTYARDGGGVLITQAIHALDLFLSVVGPPARVLAGAGRTTAHRMEAEDGIGGVLDYGSGRLVSFHATVAQFPGRAEELVVAGTNGTAVLTGSTLIHYPAARVLIDDDGSSASADPSSLPVAWHKALLTDAVEAFGSGREPLASGASALVTQRVVAAAYESASSGGWIEVAHG